MPVRYKKGYPYSVKSGNYLKDTDGNEYKVESVTFANMHYIFQCEGGKKLKAEYKDQIAIGTFDAWVPRPDLQYRDDPVRVAEPVRRAPRILPNGVVLMDGESFNAREDNDER